jgi:hypothetical protein
MSSLQEKAAQLLKDEQYDEAIAVLKRLINYAERRVAQGREGGVDSWPYSALVSIYHKQGKTDLEYKTLERFLAQPPMPGSTHMYFAKEAKMRLEQRRLFGPEGKGECQACQRHLVLKQNDLGEWLCSKCRKVREPEVKRRRWLQDVRALGLLMPDDASQVEIDDIMVLHRDVARYVGDVWYHLTGTSYRSAVKMEESSSTDGITIRIATTSPLPDFDQFVSSLFANYAPVVRLTGNGRDRTSFATATLTPEQQDALHKHLHIVAGQPLVIRLAGKEQERTGIATSNLTPEQQDDPYKYLHVVAGKPPLVQDDDYRFVVSQLQKQYGQFLPKKPWWKVW